jgi:hypothetical protein
MSQRDPFIQYRGAQLSNSAAGLSEGDLGSRCESLRNNMSQYVGVKPPSKERERHKGMVMISSMFVILMTNYD